MELLLNPSKVQSILKKQVKAKRLEQGFTQAGLAQRAGVSLPSLRKFEQKGLISLESFLKLLAVLGCLEEIANALKSGEEVFYSIDDVLKNPAQKRERKYGWRT